MTTFRVLKENRSKEKHYRRWIALNDRCNNPDHKSYATYGGRGIKVDPIWSIRTEAGYDDFHIWVEAELKKHPELIDQAFKVGRKDITKDFSPENCLLGTNETVCQNRSHTTLTFEKVVEIRQYGKANPTITLRTMADIFKQTLPNISRCLRGITWSNVDAVEEPLKSRHKQNNELTAA